MNYNKLQELIDGKKITKATVIKKTDITRPSLDSILAGNDFKVSNLEKLAKALKVPVGYFFDEDVTIEEYTATGQKGFVAKHIDNVDQREYSDISADDPETQRKKIEILQEQLLDAKTEIISLMKEIQDLKNNR